MSFTALAQKDGVPVVLSVTDNVLTISPLESVKATEKYDLKYMYGIQLHNSPPVLDIHLCQIVQSAQNEERQELSNSQHTPAVWTRLVLSFGVLDSPPATSSGHLGLDAFINRIRSQNLPEPSTVASTHISVILNRHSGARKAFGNWADIVQPMLVAAGYKHTTVVETKPDGKTREISREIGTKILDSGVPSIVICLGGDGTLHEVVNGLADAHDARQSTNQPTFRLGVVPCGSGNALSLGLQLASIEHSVLQIIKGKSEKLRLIDVSFGHCPSDSPTWYENVKYIDERPIRLLVVLSWGFHAQIVYQAKKLDFSLGNQRFGMVAMDLLANLKHYSGQLIMLNAKKYIRSRHGFGDPQEGPTLIDGVHGKKFTYFLVSKQASLEPGFKITPFASHASDDMDVLMFRQVTADQLQAASIKAFQGGRHVDEDDQDLIEYYKTPELLLRVEESDELCLDGEIHGLEEKGVVRAKIIGPGQGDPEFEVFA
ncbi:ATP-NAD kinase-like domain-containing protein [Phycomyces nitens]|nr:ATP-NAD kinase-like domain-containing protein [Phycomyces nitens]